MKRGKTITLYLIDGDANGRIMCNLSNWSGKAYKIPRNLVKVSNDRTDIHSTGVYILFGKNTENENTAYIGEAENIKQRLEQHLSQKDFWTDAVVFISKDNNLNKAHIKYMENRLYEMAKDMGRYNLENSSTPTKSNISEPDQAEMEEFMDNLVLLTNTLGYKIFEPILQSQKLLDKKDGVVSNTDNVFTIQKLNKNINAKGKSTNEGFVVLKDSVIASKIQNSVNNTMIELRNKYISDGIIISKDSNIILTKDILFSSPSSAAILVLGRSANGLTEWKCNGKSLKDF